MINLLTLIHYTQDKHYWMQRQSSGNLEPSLEVPSLFSWPKYNLDDLYEIANIASDNLSYLEKNRLIRRYTTVSWKHISPTYSTPAKTRGMRWRYASKESFDIAKDEAQGKLDRVFTAKSSFEKKEAKIDIIRDWKKQKTKTRIRILQNFKKDE